MRYWLWVSISRIQLWIRPNGFGIWTWECIFIADKSSARWRYFKREDLEIYMLKDIEIQNAYWWSFLVAQLVKNPPAIAGDPGFIPRSGKSPGGRHGNPLQYSGMENPHGQRSSGGYSPWGHKESYTTKWLSTQHMLIDTLWLEDS